MVDEQEEGQLRRSPSCDSLFGGRDEDFDFESPAQSPPQRTPVSPASPLGGEWTHIGISDVLPSWLGSDPTAGLSWGKAGLAVYPRWTISPELESIAETLKLTMGNNQDYTVRLLHEGALSKLYAVSVGGRDFVMRVCLPVRPGAKTEAEVATLGWVKQHTPLPVPRVIAHDSSRENPLGFEWVLMSKVEGTPLSECWCSVSLGLKERLVKQIAAFSAATFRQPFRGGIGGIFKTASASEAETDADADADAYVTGPFPSTRDWIRSRLQVATANLASRLDRAVDGDEEGEALRRMLDLARRVEALMPRFLPSHEPNPVIETEDDIADGRGTSERTMLCHDGLSLDNILVNDTGILTGVIDWQCVSCVPVHEACQFPAFLRQAYDRFAEPMIPRYFIDADGPPYKAYFRDLQRWEMTRLRQLYVEEMMRLAPGFVDVWRDERSAGLRDYEAAVQNCDNEFTVEIVEEWVRAMEGGRDPARMPKRLHEALER
ncbi:hypothetical protein ANO14919_133560 [Xylariales sp. No.14919]|nr:hypothetical protein ANO14919_133560 [Xylariales sp. No.14919]